MEQEFARIAATPNRRLHPLGHVPASCEETGSGFGYRLRQLCALAWRFRQAELELGLDERDRVSAVGYPKGPKLRNRLTQREIGEVQSEKVNHVCDEITVQLGEVRGFQVDDSWVLAQRPQ